MHRFAFRAAVGGGNKIETLSAAFTWQTKSISFLFCLQISTTAVALLQPVVLMPGDATPRCLHSERLQVKHNPHHFRRIT